VSNLYLCACCDGQLEPAQQLRFLVETDNLDDPAYLARIRVMPSLNGRPVPVCSGCQSKIAAQPQSLAKFLRPKAAPLSLATGLLGALGVLSVGMIFGALLNSRG
jgi:hypothetical protein